MRQRFSILCVSLLAGCHEGACVETASSSVQASRSPIVGGHIDARDAATVALLDSARSVVCSGSVVLISARKRIATAAHCADAAVMVAGGEDVLEPVFSANVVGRHVHPRWVADRRFDVALLDVDFVPEESPYLVLPSEATPELTPGQRLRVSGYGIVSPEATLPRLRHSAEIELEEIDRVSFGYAQVPAGACAGDSGGPTVLLDAPVVVGITASGDVRCADFGVSARAELLVEIELPTVDCDE